MTPTEYEHQIPFHLISDIEQQGGSSVGRMIRLNKLNSFQNAVTRTAIINWDPINTTSSAEVISDFFDLDYIDQVDELLKMGCDPNHRYRELYAIIFQAYSDPFFELIPDALEIERRIKRADEGEVYLKLPSSPIKLKFDVKKDPKFGTQLDNIHLISETTSVACVPPDIRVFWDTLPRGSKTEKIVTTGRLLGWESLFSLQEEIGHTQLPLSSQAMTAKAKSELLYEIHYDRKRKELATLIASVVKRYSIPDQSQLLSPFTEEDANAILSEEAAAKTYAFVKTSRMLIDLEWQSEPLLNSAYRFLLSTLVDYQNVTSEKIGKAAEEEYRFNH